jgi:short-subunit dehydrogenase
MSQTLHGRTILITGAARGIGAQTARLAAKRGARLALVGLEPERLEDLAGELGPRHCWAACDVTDSAELQRAVEEVLTCTGGIDVVVANAGIAGRGTVATASVEAMAKTIDVNLTGVIRTVHATLPAVRERRGHYLLVASVAAFAALPGMAAYAASKAGVEHFGGALRMEVAHTGVTVGTAHPSWIDTDMVRDARDDLPAFRRALLRAPGPLGATTSVEACAEAFLDGIERRRRRVYVPRTIAVVQALRTLINSGPGQRAALRRIDVPQMEAEVRALGRDYGRTSAAQAVTDDPATRAS